MKEPKELSATEEKEGNLIVEYALCEIGGERIYL